MSEGAISFFSFIGMLVIGLWACIGFAFSMRWGTTGLVYLWRNKERLDRIVEKDIRKPNTRQQIHVDTTLAQIERAGR
jgi:hypothetical protein